MGVEITGAAKENSAAHQRIALCFEVAPVAGSLRRAQYPAIRLDRYLVVKGRARALGGCQQRRDIGNAGDTFILLAGEFSMRLTGHTVPLS